MIVLTQSVPLPAMSVLKSMASLCFFRDALEFDTYPFASAAGIKSLREFYKTKSHAKYADLEANPIPFVDYCGLDEQEFSLSKANLRYDTDDNGDTVLREESESAFDEDDVDSVKVMRLEDVLPESLYKYYGNIIYRYMTSDGSPYVIANKNTSEQLGVQDQETGEYMYDSDLRVEDNYFSRISDLQAKSQLKYLVRKLVSMSYNDRFFYFDVLKLRALKDANPNMKFTDSYLLGKTLHHLHTVGTKAGVWTAITYKNGNPAWAEMFDATALYLNGDPSRMPQAVVEVIESILSICEQRGVSVFGDNEDTMLFAAESLPLDVAMFLPKNTEYYANKKTYRAFAEMPLNGVEQPAPALTTGDLCSAIRELIGDWAVVNDLTDACPIIPDGPIRVSDYSSYSKEELIDMLKAVAHIDMDAKYFDITDGILCVGGNPIYLPADKFGFQHFAGVNGRNVSYQHLFIMDNGFVVPILHGAVVERIYACYLPTAYNISKQLSRCSEADVCRQLSNSWYKVTCYI